MTEPLSTDQLFDRFVAQHTAEMKHRFDALLLEDLESAECYEDTIPFLREMRRRELMVIVISNLATPYVELFERLGIRELVDAVFSSCAEDVRMRKPNPKLFELALPAGIQPHEALMLGDKFANDVQGPMDCGWSALHLVREDSHQAPVDPHKTIQGLFEAIPYL